MQHHGGQLSRDVGQRWNARVPRGAKVAGHARLALAPSGPVAQRRRLAGRRRRGHARAAGGRRPAACWQLHARHKGEAPATVALPCSSASKHHCVAQSRSTDPPPQPSWQPTSRTASRRPPRWRRPRRAAPPPSTATGGSARPRHPAPRQGCRPTPDTALRVCGVARQQRQSGRWQRLGCARRCRSRPLSRLTAAPAP